MVYIIIDRSYPYQLIKSFLFNRSRIKENKQIKHSVKTIKTSTKLLPEC